MALLTTTWRCPYCEGKGLEPNTIDLPEDELDPCKRIIWFSLSAAERDSKGRLYHNYPCRRCGGAGIVAG